MNLWKPSSHDHHVKVSHYVFEGQASVDLHSMNLLKGLVHCVWKKRLKDGVYLLRGRSSSAIVDILNGDSSGMGHWCALQDVENFPHVSLAQLHYSFCSIWVQADTFCSCNLSEFHLNTLRLKRAEPKPSASGLKSGNDLGHVVANEAESSGLGILLNDSSQCKLSWACDSITLIKDDEFETLAHNLLCCAKTLDLISYHVNSSIIWCVELQDVVLVVWAKHLFGHCKYAWGLACSWRPMKEKMRQLLRLNELLYCKWELPDLLVSIISWWLMMSSKEFGLYFSTKGRLSLSSKMLT